jgi:3-hydroxyisobutyrate dehydrogenase-like beta-hydroxyacid dehydrogenase
VVAILFSVPLGLVALRVLGETNWGPISQMTNMMQVIFGGIAPGNLTVNMVSSGTTGTIAVESEALMQDYKAGYMIGSSPKSMTIMQLIGTPIGAAAVSWMYPLLRDTYGIVGEDAGLASLHDLALLSAMYGMFAGFLQAVALVGTEGVGAAAFSTLVVPWLEAMGAVLPEMARQVDRGDYTSGVESNLRMQAAGFANLTRAGREQGVEVNLLAPIQALIERRVAEGHGDEDLAGLIELLRSPARSAGVA